MDIEMNTGHEATPASAPAAPAPQTPPPANAQSVSTGEARVDRTPREESYTDSGRLTADKWKEKVKKFTGKEPKSATPQAPAAKVEEKPAPAGENPPPAGKPVEKTPEEEKEGASAQEKTPADQKFAVNPKFSAIGKEYELPKWLAESIKSPEQEKEVKDLYTKAMGLDHVKMRHQELSDKHESLNGEHTELVNGVQELRNIYAEAVQTGNIRLLDDFFQQLKIPPQVILQYAAELVNYMELPAEQKAMIDGNLQAKRQAREMQKQTALSTNSAFQAEVRARNLQLDTELARPDINAAVIAFESQPGRKPGDFKKEVIRNGEYTWFKDKVDLSINDNVAQVLQRYGLSPANPAPAASHAPQVQHAPQVPNAAQTPNTPQAQVPVVPAAHRDVPVIPSVTGKSTASPTKQKPKSIDELKAMRKQKFGS